VKSVSHFSRPAPVGVVKILFTVNFASRSCAPSNARPGVPTGRSHGGRQILRLYAPRAAAGPAVGFTWIGTTSVWPATERIMLQTAAFTPGAQPSAVCLA